MLLLALEVDVPVPAEPNPVDIAAIRIDGFSVVSETDKTSLEHGLKGARAVPSSPPRRSLT